MNEAIKISNLSKSYGTHVVLNGLDFCVQQGEIFALLGVNGAGKTTSLECIEGLRKYDSGSITINGIMGIQLQSASLPEHIKPLEAVKLFAKWNKTSLDKETAGLDVEGRLSLHEQIRQLKAIGKTIILASHDMTEVENLCDRIAILSGGKIAFIGTVEQLGKTIGKHYNITIQTENGMKKYESENIGDSLLALLMQYKEKGETIVDIQIDRGSLEQHFIKIAKGA